MAKWSLVDRPAYLYHHDDKFDDGVLDIATAVGTEDEHLYSSTIRNGLLAEEDGYLKTEVNDLGETGYSRLALTHKLAYAPHALVARSDFIIKSWGQYSDIALGFSFERKVGNIAYRGDLSLWIDNYTAKIYHRPSRGAATETIELGEIYFNPDDSIVLIAQYQNGVFTANIIKNDSSRITATASVGTTFDNSVYALLGGRGSGDVTEFWANRFIVYAGIPWTITDRPIGEWTLQNH